MNFYIFNFKTKMDIHRKYLKYLLISSLAVVLIFLCIFEFVLSQLGETGDYSEIVQLQQKTGVLFGRKYSNLSIEYKIIGIEKNRPEILILGTSRVMPIKQDFIPTKKLYNAGISASMSRGIDGMNLLMNSFKLDCLPSKIYIGLDPWVFNPNYPENNNGKVKKKIKGKIPKNLIAFKWKLMERLSSYSVLLNEKKLWISFISKNKAYRGIGLNAKIFDSGFRVDGSYQYPSGHGNSWKEKTVAQYKQSLKNNKYRFAASNTIDTYSIEKLNKLLNFAQMNKIEVIGILPPFSPNFYKALIEIEDRSIFQKKYEESIIDTLEEKGFKCYNFCDIKTYRVAIKHIDNFTDEMHPGEKLMRELIAHIISGGS